MSLHHRYPLYLLRNSSNNNHLIGGMVDLSRGLEDFDGVFTLKLALPCLGVRSSNTAGAHSEPFNLMITHLFSTSNSRAQDELFPKQFVRCLHAPVPRTFVALHLRRKFELVRRAPD